ncbi:hypothetical protein PS2_012354 [Malus domestica]
MMDYSTDEDSGTVILCSKCKAKVNIEPEEKSSPPIMEQPTVATQQKATNVGQHQGVFDRLSPKVRMEETPSVRRRLDFDAPFYDDDYYICNSSSSKSSRSQKTFKPPEPRDQRWYTYHYSKGVGSRRSRSMTRDNVNLSFSFLCQLFDPFGGPRRFGGWLDFSTRPFAQQGLRSSLCFLGDDRFSLGCSSSNHNNFFQRSVIGAYLCDLVSLFLCIYVVFP